MNREIERRPGRFPAEDLVPSEFYGKEDACRALAGARFVVDTVTSVSGTPD